MSRNRTLAVALLVSLAVLGVAPGAFAADTVTAEDGGTYEIPLTLQFDVGEGDYTLRTADGLFVNQLVAENGTVTLDTDGMDPGEYVLNDPDTGETLYEFTLVGDPSTPTATDRATETETESAAAPVPSELSVPESDRSNAADATGARVFWAGQDVAFRVDGDTSYRLLHDGEALGRLTGPDHYRYLNTTALEPGMYTVERRGGHEVYRFSVTEQTLSATATGDELAVSSNRRGFDLVLSSSNVSTTQLLDAVPSATQQDGRVVVTGVGPDTTIPVAAGSLPVGNHTVTMTVTDTGVTANATLQVVTHNDSASEATATAKGAVSTATATATATAPSTATTPSTDAPAPASTSVEAPGFGILVMLGVVLVLCGVVALLFLLQGR